MMLMLCITFTISSEHTIVDTYSLFSVPSIYWYTLDLLIICIKEVGNIVYIKFETLHPNIIGQELEYLVNVHRYFK